MTVVAKEEHDPIEISPIMPQTDIEEEMMWVVIVKAPYCHKATPVWGPFHTSRAAWRWIDKMDNPHQFSVVVIRNPNGET